MEPVTITMMVGAVAGTISSVGQLVMELKAIRDQIKTADATLMSMVAQLNSIKAALNQIQQLMQAGTYDKQIEMDLELSLQASQLHIDYIDEKISKFKTKHSAGSLKFRNRVKVVFESDDMNRCLERLNHQSTALTLLITVLTSKTVTEQKAILKRSNTRKVFKQIQEDKASLLDEAASVCVLRDAESVVNANVRMRSDPVINKNPWKRFSFDPHALSSKAYGGKMFRRQVREKETATEEVTEVESETIDDASTLVEDTESLALDTTQSNVEIGCSDDKNIKPARFSRMLAFGHGGTEISDIVTQARQLWNAPDLKSSSPLSRKSSVQTHRLSTRYFDLSIHAYTIDVHNRGVVNDEFLASYKDVSSILFAGNLSTYQHDPIRLEKDVALFAQAANDYHLWLAKIILFLDTSNVDPYGAQGLADDVSTIFMQAARAGASNNRIHVVTGEADEMAAGNIFAVCNENGRLQVNNKWAGLTKSPTV